MKRIASVSKEREKFSKKQLTKLRTVFSKMDEAAEIENLSIYCAGSYARLEASEYSDIDLFFLCGAEKSKMKDVRRNSLMLLGKVIQTVEGLHYPKFSNDCEYLTVLHTGEMLENLGNRTDDHENFFTARMLLLLESSYIYGQEQYEATIKKVVQSYFRDYPGHAKDFSPIFLMNDICRYWKTMLLNYENKRNFKNGKVSDPVKKIKQKVRNYKLKYSRMTTCFATIAAIGCLPLGVKPEAILEIVRMTPRERLNWLPTKVPAAASLVKEVLADYEEFLVKTGLPTEQLEKKFDQDEKLKLAFDSAAKYGDKMFQLLTVIDRENPSSKFLRSLVI